MLHNCKGSACFINDKGEMDPPTGVGLHRGDGRRPREMAIEEEMWEFRNQPRGWEGKPAGGGNQGQGQRVREKEEKKRRSV